MIVIPFRVCIGRNLNEVRVVTFLELKPGRSCLRQIDGLRQGGVEEPFRFLGVLFDVKPVHDRGRLFLANLPPVGYSTWVDIGLGSECGCGNR
jgi:hypothetical protein